MAVKTIEPIIKSLSNLDDFDLANDIFKRYPPLANETGEHENDHIKRMWTDFAKEGFNVPQDWETNYSKYGVVVVPEKRAIGYYSEDDEDAPIITLKRGK